MINIPLITKNLLTMVHIPFEQQIRNTLEELKKEYPYIYPEYSDVETYLRQTPPEYVKIDDLAEYLLNCESTEVEE